MSNSLDALDWLVDPPAEVPPLVAIFGDEVFLRREALKQLRTCAQGDSDELSVRTFDNDDIQWRDINDELATRSLFASGRRLVVVEGADKFVSHYRSQLEDYAAQPRTTGTLVLELSTLPSNTRLYKAIATGGWAIDCRFPKDRKDEPQRKKIITGWAKQRYQLKLPPDVAALLVETLEPALGVYDAELQKLATVGRDKPLTIELVQQYVGGWRTRTAWDMLDAALSGNAAEALVQLDRLLLGGEEPIALLAQISASLRRLAAAGRLVQLAERSGRRIPLDQVLTRVGVNKFFLPKTADQLRQVGRQRSLQLYGWLLEADLALKGSSSQRDRGRIVLEQLVARLSRAAAPAQTPAQSQSPVPAAMARNAAQRR